jgi:murein L,D-transpeptidase YcbB/YkuD
MRGRLFAAGAMVLALGSLALAFSPLSAAAEDSVPIGMAAPLPPEPAAPGPATPAPATQPPNPPQNPGNPELQALLDGSDRTALAGARLLQPGLLRQFYAEHGNEPFWDNHPEAVRSLLGAVFRAEDQGIDPALFHAEALSGRRAPLSPVARDVLTSDAILSYADALAEGAVPRRVRPRTEALHPTPIDVVAAIDRAIAAPDPAAVITALAPSAPEYETMRRAYVYYHALAVGVPVSQQDMSYSRAVRYDRYGRGGDDPRYGGYAGYDRSPRDAAYSGVSPAMAARRARQLAVNLERLRWLPRHMPRERVVVNTAIAWLQYFEDDQPVFATRVVVGMPTWQTPEFQSRISDVEFNPPWNVPPNIFRKEIQPKLARDPGYLARHHMRWRGPMTVQQAAGPYSSLGRLKFEISDSYEIYLHDTPEKYLFRHANRMKSHGCIRVEYPQELAALVLHESQADVERSIAAGRTTWQPLPRPVEVYIVYQTAAVTPSGAIAFYADPYHRDAEIWRLLTGSGGVPLAQDSGLDARRG